jgi:putative flippase GtrA
MQLHSNKELDRFFKFSIVGGIGAIIDLGVLNFLVFVWGWETELERILANICSVSLAILFNFTLHRYWTFPEYKNQNQRVQLIKFAVVSFIGLIINTIIFHLSYAHLFILFSPPSVAVQLAKSTAIGLTLFWNFGANRLWTYRELASKST